MKVEVTVPYLFILSQLFCFLARNQIIWEKRCLHTCVKVLLWRFRRLLDGRDMLAPEEEP